MSFNSRDDLQEKKINRIIVSEKKQQQQAFPSQSFLPKEIRRLVNELKFPSKTSLRFLIDLINQLVLHLISSVVRMFMVFFLLHKKRKKNQIRHTFHFRTKIIISRREKLLSNLLGGIGFLLHIF